MGQPMPPPPPQGYGTPFSAPRGSTPIDFAALGVSGGSAPGPWTNNGEPKRRGVRKVWLVLAVVVFGASAYSLVHGIVEVVHINDDTVDNAVARAQVNGSSNVAEFSATKSQTYSVYAIIDSNDSNTRDDIVASTDCEVTFADGSTTAFSGSSQGSSTTIGDVSSVGEFFASEGSVRVVCESGSGDRFDYIVSPGTAAVGAAIAFIICGAFGLFAGIICLVVALVGRRRIVGGTPGSGASPYVV
ncbi:MAG: hypothetical protein JWN39_1524 [Ilumatobacteraceae bacterium]|nr:hypothetical protein [Ilumatobacteraceae bacterium]